MSKENAAIDAAIAEFLSEGGIVRECAPPTEKDDRRAAWLDRLAFMAQKGQSRKAGATLAAWAARERKKQEA